MTQLHTDAIIGGNEYKVCRPFNSWDMNYHFINKYGYDFLVDLQDVIDWKYEDETDETKIEGATIDDAIAYARYMNDETEAKFYWKQLGGKNNEQ